MERVGDRRNDADEQKNYIAVDQFKNCIKFKYYLHILEFITMVGMICYIFADVACVNKIASIVLVILTGLSAFFAFASYLSSIYSVYFTKKIFDQGLQEDRRKILESLGLEIVIEFIIPMSNFCKRTGLDDESNLKILLKKPVFDILTMIKTSNFDSGFSFYYIHKDEVWHALISSGNGKINERGYDELKIINTFIKDVEELDIELNHFKSILIDVENEISLEDFLNTSKDMDVVDLIRICSSIKHLLSDVDKLPESLQICSALEYLR